MSRLRDRSRSTTLDRPWRARSSIWPIWQSRRYTFCRSSSAARTNVSLGSVCRLLPDMSSSWVSGSMPSGMVMMPLSLHSTLFLPLFHLQLQTAGQESEPVAGCRQASSETSSRTRMLDSVREWWKQRLEVRHILRGTREQNTRAGENYTKIWVNSDEELSIIWGSLAEVHCTALTKLLANTQHRSELRAHHWKTHVFLGWKEGKITTSFAALGGKIGLTKMHEYGVKIRIFKLAWKNYSRALKLVHYTLGGP